MKLRLFSDIHNELNRGQEYLIPPLSTDKDTVLVLAGDIDKGKQSWKYANLFSENFKAVVYVAGNHEMYGGNIDTFYDKFKENQNDNVHILEDESVLIDDVLFVGATLWTDFNNMHPLAMWQWTRRMNDHKKIRESESYSRLKAQSLFQRHKKSVQFLQSAVTEIPENVRKKVAVTHHSPTYYNEKPELVGSMNSPFYHTNLDYMLNSYDMWMFGHTHFNVDHMLGDTRVVSNQKGYTGKHHHHPCDDFDCMKIIEI